MLGTVVLNHNSDIEQVEEERKKNISNLDHLYGSFRFQSIAIAPLIVGIILAGILLLLCTRVIQCSVCVCSLCTAYPYRDNRNTWDDNFNLCSSPLTLR